MRSIILVALIMGSAVVSPALSANVVVNGNFETGDLTGWTTNNAIGYAWGVTTDGPKDGAFAASTGCVGAPCSDQTNPGTAQNLSQNLTTTAGGVYTLAFDFSPNGGFANELKVLWDGAVIFDMTNILDTGSLVNYSVSGLVAGGGTTTLTFLGRQDPGYDRLDNISVDQTGQTSDVPEAASWAMFIGGLGLTGAAMRRRKTAVSFA